MTVNKVYINNRGGVKLPARDSNLELFRILTMLLIIAHHYVVNSGLLLAEGPVYADPVSWRSLFLLCFGAWGKIGINCFVLITGYFMCESHITARKFLKLILEVLFYRTIITIIFWVTGYEPFSLAGVVKVLIPIRSIGAGFTNAYMVFYLFIPFLNVLIHNINEKQYVSLLALCGFTYVFLGTVPGMSVTMNYVSWFMVVFLIGAYLRMYPKKHSDDGMFWRRISAVLIGTDLASVVVCTWIGAKTGRHIPYYFVSDSNTFLAVVTGISLFMWFKNLHMRYSELINKLAASTFGVLLIHASSDTMRRWLWKDLLDVVGYYEFSWMPIYAIGCIIGIFIVCVAIDQLRIVFIEKPVLKFVVMRLKQIEKRYRKMDNKI